MTTRRFSVVCAAALTVLTLSACQSGTKTEQASSTTTQSASSTAPATTSAATTSTTTTSTTATTSAAAKPAGDQVAPTDLPGVVSDRTFRGNDGQSQYSEYYAPDGTLRGKSGTETYSGSWKVVGEQLCFNYPGKTNETDCYAVFKNGDVITWVDANGELVEATYAEGNPDGL